MAVSSGIAAPRRAALGASLAALACSHAAAGRSRATPAGHIVLLGDSIFDNGAYVASRRDVVTQLRPLLPAGWRATLTAVGGAVALDVRRQLDWSPAEVSHLVVSVGGNDALRQEGLLVQPARRVGEALTRLIGVVDRFRQDYQAMLDTLLARRLPTALCTIYDPRFPDPLRQRRGAAGLTLFNDVIAREAFLRGLPLIDLRLVCNEDADFATPIKPSIQGGGKIAATIAQLVAEHDFRQHRCTVYGMAPADRHR